MAFTDLNFIVRFLPVFLVVYYICPKQLRNGILLIGSILFCALGDWKNAILLLGMTVVDYVLLFVMQKRKDSQRTFVFVCLLILNIGTLLMYKFVVHRLPAGISFYTFMAVSAVIDVYRRQAKLSDFVTFATYLTMFPKQLQGPVVQYRDIKQELANRTYTLDRLEHGLEFFVVGLGYKVLIADTMGKLWHQVQAIGFESISTPMAWLGVLAFSMQLYFDFQGYSLMAIGVAGMLGFKFPKNFDHPYAAATVSEYYRRWHITLGRWFRDYVYIPLGGNRVGTGRVLFNLFVVWFLTGLWHGVTPNFLIWAGVLLLFIVLEKIFYGKFMNKHKVVSHIYIWFVIPLTWIIFAITDLGQLGVYFTRLFPLWGTGIQVNSMDFVYYGKSYIAVVLLAFVVSLPKAEKLFMKYRDKIWMKIVLFALFWVCAYMIANGENNPFLYSAF